MDQPNKKLISPFEIYPFEYFDKDGHAIPDFIAYKETPETMGITPEEFLMRAALDIKYARELDCKNTVSAEPLSVSTSPEDPRELERREPMNNVLPAVPIKPVPTALPSGIIRTTNQDLVPSLMQSIPERNCPKPQAPDFKVSICDVKDHHAEATPYSIARELATRIRLMIIGNVIYLFDGKIYRILTEIELKRQLVAFCRPFVEQYGNAGIIKQIYDCLFIEPTLSHKKLEPPSTLVAFQNVVLDVQTMCTMPHSPGLFLTSILNANYSSSGDPVCPVMDAVLAQISSGDPLLTQRIWEFMGYCLVPDMAGKCFFLMQGEPDSGKSLLGGFLGHCFGEDDVTSLDLNAFGERFALAELINKRLDLALDMPACVLDAQAVSNLKLLTGGDIITTDVKYQPRAKFYNSCKFIMATNHSFTTKVSDPALFRRLVVIPFRNSIDKSMQDTLLSYKLDAERDAIIKKALLAYRYLRSNNYNFSGDFRVNDLISKSVATDTCHIGCDQLISDFLYNFCVVEQEATTFLGDLFAAFSRITGGQNMTFAQFSNRVEDIISSCFGAAVKKDRKRKPDAKNPTSCLLGLRLNI